MERWKKLVDAGLVKFPGAEEPQEATGAERVVPRSLRGDAQHTAAGTVRVYELGHPGEEWYSTKESAVRLGVSGATLTRWLRNGLLRTVVKREIEDVSGSTTCCFYRVDEVEALRVRRREEGKL